MGKESGGVSARDVRLKRTRGPAASKVSAPTKYLGCRVTTLGDQPGPLEKQAPPKEVVHFSEVPG